MFLSVKQVSLFLYVFLLVNLCTMLTVPEMRTLGNLDRLLTMSVIRTLVNLDSFFFTVSVIRTMVNFDSFLTVSVIC